VYYSKKSEEIAGFFAVQRFPVRLLLLFHLLRNSQRRWASLQESGAILKVFEK
jgi:hypothetical protein